MGRKALLSAGVYLVGNPLLQVIYSMVVIVVSVVQQKRSKPYLAGKHVIREAELEGATITLVDDAEAQGCCCRCCKTFTSSFILLVLALALVLTATTLEGSGAAAEASALFVLGLIVICVCSPVALCTNISRFCCPPIKDPVTLTVTSGDQSYSVVVSPQQSEALIAAGKVIRREHETNVDSDCKNEESGADKLEVVALLCVLGNYALAAVCYLVNKDKSDAERSSALDIVVFIAAVIFTLAPFFLARKYREAEDSGLAEQNKVKVIQEPKEGP
jgi:heme/copper-type cytochrome/quinol oxidase subunit 4